MKRHIIIDLVCDTDDNEAKHALLDDIRQELNCCWHSDISYTMCEAEEDKADRKTEPNCSEKPNNSTISKMEQVDKDINVRSKTEPQTDCDNLINAVVKLDMSREDKFKVIELLERHCEKCKHYLFTDIDGYYCEHETYGQRCAYEPKTEPQTEREGE